MTLPNRILFDNTMVLFIRFKSSSASAAQPAMPVKATTPPGAAMRQACCTTEPIPVHSITTSGEIANSGIGPLW